MRVMREVSQKIHPTAIVEEGVEFQGNAHVWHFSHLRSGATIGSDVVIGGYVLIDAEVIIGGNCKIQSGSRLYSPTKLEFGAFIGPNVICTNDNYPRAINVDGSLKKKADWERAGVIIRTGASIGAGSVCVAPVEIGAWALVAAGSVVTKDVLPYSLVAGNPARFKKWVGRFGVPLEQFQDDIFICPVSGERYRKIDNKELVLE